MQSRIIGFTILVGFLLGALIVFGIDTAIHKHRKKKAAEKQRRKNEFIKYFKKDIVPFNIAPAKGSQR